MVLDPFELLRFCVSSWILAAAGVHIALHALFIEAAFPVPSAVVEFAEDLFEAALLLGIQKGANIVSRFLKNFFHMGAHLHAKPHHSFVLLFEGGLNFFGLRGLEIQVGLKAADESLLRPPASLLEIGPPDGFALDALL